jgi:ATPase subunit of ABC transporter with duplicated ATPase domains
VSYDEYMRVRAAALQKQERLAQMEKREDRARQERFDRIENAVAHAQDTISRGDPHGGRLLKKKMKAVKSLEKRFEREREDMTARPNVEYGLAASFDAGVSLPRGKVVLELTLPALIAGGRTLAQNVALRVAGPEKVLLLGENGAGKTTLLHLIAETLLPRRDITAAYMPQRYEELLCGEETPAEFLRAGGDKERLTRARTYLGAAKFTTDEMAHPLSGLSGGQKAKLLFLKMILDGADTLILDEPTRNLSPLSAPVIRDLIRCFPGAVIAVTHDRLLMRELTDARVLRLTQDGLVPVSAQELAQI